MVSRLAPLWSDARPGRQLVEPRWSRCSRRRSDAQGAAPRTRCANDHRISHRTVEPVRELGWMGGAISPHAVNLHVPLATRSRGTLAPPPRRARRFRQNRQHASGDKPSTAAASRGSETSAMLDERYALLMPRPVATSGADLEAGRPSVEPGRPATGRRRRSSGTDSHTPGTASPTRNQIVGRHQAVLLSCSGRCAVPPSRHGPVPRPASRPCRQP